MITRITTNYFKRFEHQEFDLGPISVLAGPNNSGKSTLLQAVMVWNLAMQKWCEKKGPGSGSRAKDRQGAPITRQEFSALPLPSMDQLWTDTHTSLRKDEVEGKSAGSPRPMVISLAGKDKRGADWHFGFEFRYSGPEQIHVKPAQGDIEFLEVAKNEVDVIYVPPFSGIGVHETRYDRPYQDMLIGQGKGGDILRNLLLEVSEKGTSSWENLVSIIKQIFNYTLLKPIYTGTPYITCQYLKGTPEGNGYGGLSPLDVSTTGSGFHQVLLILSFMFARKSSLLLLDEPDAHLHVLLQHELYELLLSLCHQRGCQLVVATHSEVLIDTTSAGNIVSFYHHPHTLNFEYERDQVCLALKRITSRDLLLAEEAPGILYVEGGTDFDLLKAWSKILNHRLQEWFSNMPFWHDNQGCNPEEAKSHFFALQSIKPEMKGILLLDGDNKNIPNHNLQARNLSILRWDRYEIESYLLHPNAIRRFLFDYYTGGLLAQLADPAMEYFKQQMPPAFFSNPLDNSITLISTPVSKTLLPEIMRRASVNLDKNEYFLIANQMKPEELPKEITEKLDAIAAAVMPNV